MVLYDISDWTPSIESKLIMVIFVQLIQRYLISLRPGIKHTSIYS